MVSVIRIKTPHAAPDYSIYWFVVDEPALAGLHHDLWGWDLVALIGFIGRKIDVARLDFRDAEAREWLDRIGTVPAPSRTQKQAEKRPAGQSMKMIQDYVVDHPGCTRLEIAKAIGRKKTPTVIGQIECLVLLGALAKTAIERQPDVYEFHYVWLGPDDVQT